MINQLASGLGNGSFNGSRLNTRSSTSDIIEPLRFFKKRQLGTRNFTRLHVHELSGCGWRVHLYKTRQYVWEASVLTTGLVVRTLALFGPSSDPSQLSSQLVLFLLRSFFQVLSKFSDFFLLQKPILSVRGMCRCQFVYQFTII